MPKHKKHHDQDDSDNDSSQDSQNQLKINTDNSPKIIPVAKLTDKPKYKKIVINVSDTQYPIITEIGQQLGWIIQDEQGIGDWDVWWTDRQIQPNTLYRMNLHQKINHFPGIYVLARKNLLGLHLMAMQRKFPNDYNFFPQTWMLPMQFPQFRQFYQSVQEGKVRTFIVKPQALSQGRGIFLTRNIEDVINGNKYVVQRYLKNPLLLDGLKFDLRIYVLLAGSDPLRLYIYQEGLARLATRPYQAPTADNLHQNYIHLTNYSLNKTNPDYIYNKSDKQMDVGHKRSLKGVYQKLSKSGIDMQKLKTQIQDCIIKTVISGLPSIRHQYQYCQPEQYQGNMCFHILGFDVMILEDLTPIVIQVNHTPSFQTGTPLDYQIKKNLIKDTLKLMRITQKEKKTLFTKSKELTKRRIQTGKRDILKGEQRKQHLSKVQVHRDEEQKQILNNLEKPSGYKAIFPFKDQKKNQLYAKFYQGAQQVMREQKDMRKKIISEDSSSSKKQVNNQPSKNSKHSRNTSIKDASVQRNFTKKQTFNSGCTKDICQQKKLNPQQKSLENSDNSNQQNSNNNCMNSDQVIQVTDEIQSADKETQSIPNTSNTSQVFNSQKKIVYSSTHKGIFQIRNNKFGRKNSLNSPQQTHQKIPNSLNPSNDEQIEKHDAGKYQQLMEKFIKSKDLDDPQQNQVSVKGQVLFEQKLNNGRKSRSSNDQEYFTKDFGSINYLAQIREQAIKQRQKYKNQIGFSMVKGYKNKNSTNSSHCNKPYEKQKFQDNHILRFSNLKTSKGVRNSIDSEHFNLSSLNSCNTGTKQLIIQNMFSNIPNNNHAPLQVTTSNGKQINKNIKNQQKIGKFLKPKTYNLHENKFPQDDKFIIRSNNNISNTSHHVQSIVLNMNVNGNILNFQQYNDFYSCTGTGAPVTSQVRQHGYEGRNKIQLNQRQIGTFINSKPTTSHKTKSSSVVYKLDSTPSKDNPILMKLIDKVKIRGYQ